VTLVIAFSTFLFVETNNASLLFDVADDDDADADADDADDEMTRKKAKLLFLN